MFGIPRIVVLVILAGWLLRLLVWVFVLDKPERTSTSDSIEFHNIALNLLETGSYSKSIINPAIPDFQRMPAYPFLMTLTYRLFGASHANVLLLNHMFFILTALLLYRVTRLVFSETSGLWAVTVLSFDPSSILAVNTIMAEGLYATVFLAAWFFLIRFVGRRKLWDACFLGLGLGLATLTKPASTYFPLLVLPVMIVLTWKMCNGRRLLAAGVITLLSYAAVLGPWICRNHMLTGRLVVTSMQAHQLLYYHAAMVRSNAENITLSESQTAIRREIGDSASGELEEALDPQMLDTRHRKALEIVTTHPLTYVLLSAEGMFFTMVDPNRHFLSKFLTGETGAGIWQVFAKSGLTGIVSRTIRESWPVFVAMMLSLSYILSVNIFMGFGILHTALDPAKRAALFCLLVWIMMCLLTVGPNPGARFRVMFMPEMAALAGVGLNAMLLQWRTRKKGQHA